VEDICANLTAARASGLLSAWQTAWEPRRLAEFGPPNWRVVYDPPTDLPAGSVVLVPKVLRDDLPIEWQGSELGYRLEFIDLPLPGADRYVLGLRSLGLARLQIELLWQRMRHSGQFDEDRFRTEATSAARAAIEENLAAFDEHLRLAGDVIDGTRRHFYPVEVYLVDLTVVAATTLGAGLLRQLQQPGAQNLLISGETLQTLASRHPETLALLRQRVTSGEVSLVGGEFSEDELPLLPRELVLENFRKGLRVYSELLGKTPRVFGRRRAGLSPMLPAVLMSLGFRGALHFTLDDGQFPLGEQAKIRWESPDYSAVDALARPPRRADDPCTALRFAEDVAHAMDHDHVATLVYAHWPGQTDPHYAALREFGNTSPALGSWVTLDRYFEQTDHPTRSERFRADEYQYPYLQQRSSENKPIERLVQRHTHGTTGEANGIARLLTTLAVPRNVKLSSTNKATSPVETLAASMPRSTDEPQCGMLAINPSSYPRVISLPDQTESVATPALGFVWQNLTEPPVPAVAIDLPNRSIKNEIFEVTLHSERGGIVGCFLPKVRGTLLSQQLAIRQNHAARDEPVYTRMVADTITIGAATPLVKSLVAQGKLLGENDQPVANFQQTVELRSQSHMFIVAGEIALLREVPFEPSHSYVASRLAWHDEGANLVRSLAGLEISSDADWIESPEFVLMQTTKARLGLIAGGLAWHRRVGARTLDTLLASTGSGIISFRFGITVDHCCPAGAPRELLASPQSLSETASPPRGQAAAWLLQLAPASVLMTAAEPIVPGDIFSSGGMRVRLLETRGESTVATLAVARSVAAARQYSFSGEPQVELKVEDDRITIELGSAEWVEVWVAWK
jgi:alpha-mannosidase